MNHATNHSNQFRQNHTDNSDVFQDLSSLDAPHILRNAKQIQKKRKRAPGFRAFWVKHMKPNLKKNTKIYKLSICKEMFNCKELSLKRIKETLMRVCKEESSSREEIRSFCMYMVQIFDTNLEIEQKFEKYTKELREWFRKHMDIQEEPKITIPVKYFLEIQRQNSLLSLEKQMLEGKLQTIITFNVKSEEEETAEKESQIEVKSESTSY